jgi:hypothetical protein
MSSDRFGACVAKAPPVRESCGFDKGTTPCFSHSDECRQNGKGTVYSSIQYSLLRAAAAVKFHPGKFLPT